MMDLLWNNYPLKTENKNKSLLYTAKILSPALLCGTFLIVISYITDIIYTKSAVLNLGETTSVASLVFSTGNLISKLSFSIISITIALLTGGIYALPSGILGGLLIVSGSTSQNITGSIAGISGVIGCIAAGFLSGYTIKLCKKIFSKSSNKTYLEIFCPALSLILTLLGVFAINSISSYINSISNTLLMFAGEKQSIFLPVLLGIFITTDPGGPLFLSSYFFGASSLATGQAHIMAAVVAAGMIPSLSVGLFAFLYKNRFDPSERINAYCALAASLVGISQLSFPFYVSRSYKFLLPCIPGGLLSAILAVLFRCKTNYPMGGFITYSSEGKPLFFLVAIICGVLTSTALMSITIKEPHAENHPQKTESPAQTLAQA